MLHLFQFFLIMRCCLLSCTSQLCHCWITADGLVASKLKPQSHLCCMCCHRCSLFWLHVSTMFSAICPSPFFMAGNLAHLVSIALGNPFVIAAGALVVPVLKHHIFADSPPVDQLIHFIWQFLKPCDHRAWAEAPILWNFYRIVHAVTVLAPASTLASHTHLLANWTHSVPPAVFFMHQPCCSSTSSMAISSAASVVSTPTITTIGTKPMLPCNVPVFTCHLPACPPWASLTASGPVPHVFL